MNEAAFNDQSRWSEAEVSGNLFDKAERFGGCTRIRSIDLGNYMTAHIATCRTCNPEGLMLQRAVVTYRHRDHCYEKSSVWVYTSDAAIRRIAWDLVLTMQYDLDTGWLEA